jgi:hypothetical protein
MSAHGERLELPDHAPEGLTLEATCPATGECYRLTGSVCQRIAN